MSRFLTAVLASAPLVMVARSFHEVDLRALADLFRADPAPRDFPLGTSTVPGTPERPSPTGETPEPYGG